MTDAEFVSTALRHLEALNTACCEYLEADEASPRDVALVQERRRVVDAKRQELIPFASDRLDQLGTHNLQAFPGKWGMHFLEELMGTPGEPISTLFSRMRGRHPDVLKLSKYLQSSELCRKIGTPPAYPLLPLDPLSDGTKQGEGGTPPKLPADPLLPAAVKKESEGGRPKRVTKEEANILVRDWLTKNAMDNPAGITRDAVAAGTGASAGTVSNCAAWKAFRDRRDAEAKPGERVIPLSETMQASIPADCARPDELAAQIEEQEAELAKETRRQKRRHEPS